MSNGDWYPDPLKHYSERFFDGEAWTSKVREADGVVLNDSSSIPDDLAVPAPRPESATVEKWSLRALVLWTYGIAAVISAGAGILVEATRSAGVDDSTRVAGFITSALIGAVAGGATWGTLALCGVVLVRGMRGPRVDGASSDGDDGISQQVSKDSEIRRATRMRAFAVCGLGFGAIVLGVFVGALGARAGFFDSVLGNSYTEEQVIEVRRDSGIAAAKLGFERGFEEGKAEGEDEGFSNGLGAGCSVLFDRAETDRLMDFYPFQRGDSYAYYYTREQCFLLGMTRSR